MFSNLRSIQDSAFISLSWEEQLKTICIDKYNLAVISSHIYIHTIKDNEGSRFVKLGRGDF